MRPLLIALVLALGGLLYLQWYAWPPAPPALPQPAPPSAPPSGGDSALPAQELLAPEPIAEDYASIAERPLFLPERRPPPDEPEAEAEQSQPNHLTELDGMDLNAVVIAPSGVSAWVRSPRQKELVRVRLGDDLEGWTVKDIHPDALVLERQGETDQIVLRDYEHTPPAASPGVRNPAAPQRLPRGAVPQSTNGRRPTAIPTPRPPD